MIPPSKWSLSDLSQRATCRRIGLRRPSHVIQSIVSKRATSLSRTGANSTNNRLGATRARRNASEGQAPSRVSRGRSALRTHEYGLRTDKFRPANRARTDPVLLSYESRRLYRPSRDCCLGRGPALSASASLAFTFAGRASVSGASDTCANLPARPRCLRSWAPWRYLPDSTLGQSGGLPDPLVGPAQVDGALYRASARSGDGILDFADRGTDALDLL